MTHKLFTLKACNLLLLLMLHTMTVSARSTFSITRFGAVGDGTTDCTKAINKAIRRCSEKGGGIVTVPTGHFRTGTIYLCSGVTLHLEKDAVIEGSLSPADYAFLEPLHDLSRYDSGGGTVNANCSTDRQWTKALIIGNGLHDIAITGEGTIDGQHVFDPQGEEHMRGPHTLLLAECSNVRIEGIRFTRASNYAILGYALEKATFCHLTITEGWDGIHIRGGHQVSITQCTLETGDDAIAGGYWQQMSISDCHINSSCNGIRIIMPCDGVDIGNCHFQGPGVYPHRTSGEARRCNMLFGISLEPGGWGDAPGDMRHIRLHGLTMDCLSAPVSISIRKECHAYDLTVENLTATHLQGAMSATVCWNDTGFDNITLHNIRLSR